MKKILLAFTFVIAALAPKVSLAQSPTPSFTTAHDSISITVDSTGTYYDDITNIVGYDINMKWEVVASDFPSDWITPSALSMCDNNTCYNNLGMHLWNGSLGGQKSATYYHNSAHDSAQGFDYLPVLTYTSGGTHYITVRFVDSTLGAAGYGYTKFITFIVSRSGAPTNSVANTTSVDNTVNLYPNPAINEVNIVYNAGADVKNIAVYNIIGKMMAVYKVSDPDGANINIENMPAGIYLARITNSRGEVVATKRFAKQ
jgi:Secretion system C-terminal sorting domain